MGIDKRHINGRVFEIVYKENIAEIYELKNDNRYFCFDIVNELDTDTENKYIECWCELENN